MRARSGQCISMTEIAQLLSKSCESSMVPVNGSRCIVNGEYHTVHFIEDVSYQVLYGAARLTREEEKISGDNYVCRQEDGGRFVMCLSDGMGSGMEACKESETVVELLEQFMESGFSQETAAKNGQLRSGIKRPGWHVFHSRYMCSGPIYWNLQFSEGRGGIDFYKKRSLGGVNHFGKPGSRTCAAD